MTNSRIGNLTRLIVTLAIRNDYAYISHTTEIPGSFFHPNTKKKEKRARHILVVRKRRQTRKFAGHTYVLLQNKIKMPNGWRTINSLVHKIRLHGRRGKGMAESFSRQKSRHAPQKEGGLKILCDLTPV